MNEPHTHSLSLSLTFFHIFHKLYNAQLSDLWCDNQWHTPWVEVKVGKKNEGKMITHKSKANLTISLLQQQQKKRHFMPKKVNIIDWCDHCHPSNAHTHTHTRRCLSQRCLLVAKIFARNDVKMFRSVCASTNIPSSKNVKHNGRNTRLRNLTTITSSITLSWRESVFEKRDEYSMKTNE